MRKLFISLIIGLSLCLSSCGLAEKFYEDANYESITNEKGDIKLYSGGELIRELKDVKIIYSDSNSFAMWIKLSNGEIYYWQGEALMHMN